ncbi:hypothetical protein H5410_031967 [Solanum commersonii]|uniref:Uncharacterized protein n=1 Tax=Solanum commersonii TaxID=4109 RepID=A0A9J5YKS3_SOLCO|nr:hypothetical protein H5410_031967 [Solanum commersonii]
MEPVGPDDQNGPYSRSNEPRSNQLALTARTDHFHGHTIPEQNFDVIFSKNVHERPLRPKLRSQLALIAKTAHNQGQTSLGTSKPPILPIFVCYSSPFFLVFQNSNWITTTKTTHFQGQTCPRAGKPPVCLFFECYCPWIFVDLKFQRHSFQIFIRTSIKTLPMELVGHHGQNDPFSRSNEPHNRSRFLTSFLPNFFMYVRYGLRYVFTIFFGVPEFNVICAKNLYGRPLRL